MKTSDSAGRFVGVHHQMKLYHPISQLQRLLSAPTDQFHVCDSLEFSHDFLLISFCEAKLQLKNLITHQVKRTSEQFRPKVDSSTGVKLGSECGALKPGI